MTLSQPDTFRRAAITTLGCKVNAYESALIAQKLQQDQWTVVSPKDTADLYVINSCTVTAEAGRQTGLPGFWPFSVLPFEGERGHWQIVY